MLNMKITLCPAAKEAIEKAATRYNEVKKTNHPVEYLLQVFAWSEADRTNETWQSAPSIEPEGNHD